MRVILFALGLLAFLAGMGILSMASTTNSAIHEIEAFILFLIAAVLVSGAAIVEAIGLLRKALNK